MTTLIRWLSRLTLAAAALIFLLIGSKYVLDPASAAAGSGMSLATLFGRTNMRAGVGGLALGTAAVTLLCLFSANRLRLGLWFVLVMVSPVLLVRLYGVAVDGTFFASRRILLPETLLLLLASTGLVLGRPRERQAVPRIPPGTRTTPADAGWEHAGWRR